MATKKRAHFGDAIDIKKHDRSAKTTIGSEKSKESKNIQTSRAGKKPVAMYLDMESRKQLKMLAVETERTQESLLIEGLNDLFKKHHKPSIA